MKTTLNTPFSINPDIKGVFDADGKDILGLSDDDDAELVRVVNQHDQLTAINQELIEALVRILSWDEVDVETRINIGSNGVRDYYRSVAEKAIKRAKELTNEG